MGEIALVDVEGWALELAVLVEFVEVVNTGCGLLRKTSDLFEVLGVLVVDHGSQVTAILSPLGQTVIMAGRLPTPYVENHVQRLAVRESGKSLLN